MLYLAHPIWGVLLCGATDCFLHALFPTFKDALEWANKNSKNPEGYEIRHYLTFDEINKDMV